MAKAVFDAREWRAGWPVVLASLAGITLCSAHGYTIGVMIGPLEQAFGWSRAAITGGLLIIAVVAVFAAPVAGRMADRFGPRRVALAGVPLFCLGFGLLATANGNIWGWWALWLFLAIGNMAILPTIWTAAVNSRFDANRGKALAFALCGTGLAAFILPPATTRLVAAYGWQGGYVALAVAGFLIVFPLTLLAFRSAPQAAPSPAQPAAARPSRKELRAEMRSARFLKLLGASTVFSIAICALTTNAVPVLRGLGHDPIAAADTAALMGFGSVLGRIAGGFLLDRFDAKLVAAVSVVAPAVTALLLLYAGADREVAMAACFIMGLAIGAEVDACAYLAARHFGMANFGALFGTINGLMLFGNGIAPFAANYVYDVSGSYSAVLWAQIPAYVLAAALFLALGRYPDEEAPRAAAGGETAPA
jgi:predicted MFS family arabinose efflux permease